MGYLNKHFIAADKAPHVFLWFAVQKEQNMQDAGASEYELFKRKTFLLSTLRKIAASPFFPASKTSSALGSESNFNINLIRPHW